MGLMGLLLRFYDCFTDFTKIWIPYSAKLRLHHPK